MLVKEEFGTAYTTRMYKQQCTPKKGPVLGTVIFCSLKSQDIRISTADATHLARKKNGSPFTSYSYHAAAAAVSLPAGSNRGEYDTTYDCCCIISTTHKTTTPSPRTNFQAGFLTLPKAPLSVGRRCCMSLLSWISMDLAGPR